MDKANKYTVGFNAGEEYEVKGQYGQCVVNVVNKVCSCRKSELTGIPCAHDIATNYNMALNGIQVGIPEEWVHKCYWLATWKHAYSYTLGCLNGKVMWNKSQISTTLTPPKHHTPVGRPRKNRRKTKEKKGTNGIIPSTAAGTRKSPSDAGKKKTRKGQNQNKTGQKREAWKSPAMSKVSHSRESRKKKENTKSRDQYWQFLKVVLIQVKEKD
nr:hypothetical protein [Tanacetum cinerariifolium]